MSVLVRPFQVSDYTAFVPIEPLADTGDTEFIQAIEDSGLAVTGIRNGEIAGCGGVHPINELQGEMWLRLSRDCLDHKIDTLRWLRCGMKIIEETYPFEQLNATVQCCFGRSIKMIEWLGFTFKEELTEEDKRWLIYSKKV